MSELWKAEYAAGSLEHPQGYELTIPNTGCKGHNLVANALLHMLGDDGCNDLKIASAHACHWPAAMLVPYWP